MDASNVFKNMLRNIEDSKLNYSMSRTPFSASISLKCSFAKRFGDASKKTDVDSLEKLSRNDFHIGDKKVRELETENFKLQDETTKLKMTFENDKKKTVEELVKLQKLYDCEKEKSNASELKISEFREK